MAYYKDYLEKKKISVSIIENSQPEAHISKLIESLSQKGINKIALYDPCDYLLERRMTRAATKCAVELEIFDSPAFLLSRNEALGELKNLKKYHQTTFYINQRKKYKMLLDSVGKPVGGKWSFDEENREKYPANKKPPRPHIPTADKVLEKAILSIEKNYPANPGSTDSFVYPLTHKDAQLWLDEFIEHRFRDFGVYEDAIAKKEWLLHHSLLSPLLNAGLITPKEVLDKVLHAAEKNKIPINSVEGFVRQIIGWREYIRAVYVVAGSKQRTTNAWSFNKKMPMAFYSGTTGIDPLDDSIKKLLGNGYNHHIERLMIISNFMMLCEIDPNEVYQWFMEMYIDAYDWVMVPNVYGMAQFSDGGLMCTKPYISGSRYILKMSDYPKNVPWTETWDALYWRFIHVHRAFFQGNPRLAIMPAMFDKFEEGKKQHLLQKAQDFLSTLE